MTEDGLAQRQRAAVLLEMRRPAEARAILEPLLGRDPRDAKATVLLASCCQQEGDPARSLDLCRAAAALAPDDVVLLLDCASVARAAGHPYAARTWAQRSLAQSPGNLRALNVLSLAEAALKLPGPALAHAAEALRISPDDAELRVAYALALSANGRPAEATEQYVGVLEAHPAHVYALNNLAAERLRVGDLQRSTRLFARAVAADPRMRIAAGNILITARASRRMLLSRLALTIGLVCLARELGPVPAYVTAALSVVWVAWSFGRVPATVRKRLGAGLTTGDFIGAAIVVLGGALTLGSEPGTGESLPGSLVLICYGLLVTGVTAVRRSRVDSELRKRGVRLPR